MQPSGSKIKVLFLCTGNSARSQMAEGWARYLKSDVIEPYSAGTEAHGLNPLAVEVMKEAGIDVSNQRSKLVTTLLDMTFDYVVTVCSHANENCPVFPGKVKVIHFGFDDPARAEGTKEEKTEVFRRVRDEIKTFIEGLPESLTRHS